MALKLALRPINSRSSEFDERFGEFNTKQGVVDVGGLVPNERERVAEFDTGLTFAVDNVINRIELQEPSSKLSRSTIDIRVQSRRCQSTWSNLRWLRYLKAR